MEKRMFKYVPKHNQVRGESSMLKGENFFQTGVTRIKGCCRDDLGRIRVKRTSVIAKETVALLTAEGRS